MRRWICGLLCVLLVVALAVGAGAAEGSGEAVSAGTITQYEARWVVDDRGSASATVTLELNLTAAVTEIDFPIGQGRSGSLSGYETKTVDTEDGRALRLTSEAGLTGQQHFTLTYSLDGVLTATDAGQQLAFDVIPPGWDFPMESVSFSVTMPAAFTGEPTFTGGYYGDTVGDYLTVVHDGASFSGTFTEALRDHDSLSVSLALPADYVDLRSAAGISSLVTLILVAVLAGLCLFYWYRTLRNPQLAVRLRPRPPDGAGAGDLPMLLTGAPPSPALQVMQWASLGYLAVHIGRNGRIVLRKAMDMGTERRKPERAAFARLFEREDWCDGESLRFGRLAGWYAAAMGAWWRRRLFSRTSGSPALLHLGAALASGVAMLGAASSGLPAGRLRGLLLVLCGIAGAVLGLVLQHAVPAAARRQYRKALLLAIPLVVLLVAARLWGGLLPTVLALALQLFAAAATLRGGRRSPGGRDNLAQTLGFRRYVQHVSAHQLRLFLRDDGQYLYDLFPFAEAMGLGGELASRLPDVQLEPCAWLESRRHPPQTAAGFHAALRETLDRMERATRRE